MGHQRRTNRARLSAAKWRLGILRDGAGAGVDVALSFETWITRATPRGRILSGPGAGVAADECGAGPLRHAGDLRHRCAGAREGKPRSDGHSAAERSTDADP